MNEVCSVDGFCYRDSIRFLAEVKWIWGATSNDYWMAGPRAIIHSVNGVLSGLTALPTSVRPIHGTSTSDVWIGTRHWDGATLTDVPATPPGKRWFASPSDGWAINGTKMAHWNGATWSDVTTPAVFPITDVWGFASNDIYATAGPALLHWDGTQWGPGSPALPAGADARSVWGVSPNDFWIGGAGVIWQVLNGTLMTRSQGNTPWVEISGSSASNVLFRSEGGGFAHWIGTGFKVSNNAFNNPTTNNCGYGSRRMSRRSRSIFVRSR